MVILSSLVVVLKPVYSGMTGSDVAHIEDLMRNHAHIIAREQCKGCGHGICAKAV